MQMDQAYRYVSSNLHLCAIILFFTDIFPCTYSHRAAISRDPFYEMLAARKKKVSSMKRH